MNLHQLISPVISAVNPAQPATVYFSTGQSTTTADGTRVPQYEDPFPATVQVQPISTGDLRKLDTLNIQGINQKLYMNGQLRGIQRVNKLGGDLVVLKSGRTFLVKAVLEGWDNVGWCCAAVLEQNDAPVPYQDEPRF